MPGVFRGNSIGSRKSSLLTGVRDESALIVLDWNEIGRNAHFERVFLFYFEIKGSHPIDMKL